MIGIVLAAHGPVPGALLESASMIIGDLPQVATISLLPGDSLDGLIDRLHAAADEVNTGDGVLVLLDLFGGTPANAAALLTQQTRDIYAVTGMNLPMLLETLMMRPSAEGVAALAETATTAGQSGVVNIVEALKSFHSASAS